MKIVGTAVYLFRFYLVHIIEYLLSNDNHDRIIDCIWKIYIFEPDLSNGNNEVVEKCAWRKNEKK